MKFLLQKLAHKSIYDGGKYLLVDLFREIGDQRVINSHWLVQNGMLHSVLIVAVYLLFCLVIGPRFMRNRAPYSLKWPMVVYNLSMALANLFFLIIWIGITRFGSEVLDFHAPDPNDRSEYTTRTIKFNYAYWIIKYLDFSDSLFFVLRKKFSQLNLLHLYHHSSVAIFGTLLFILYPTGKPLDIFILLNSLIHTIMYAYYGLAALGPRMQPYLWWKRYITQMQIVQFVIYIIYLIPFSLYQTGYLPIINILGGTQAPLFLCLFVQFYRNSYLRPVNKTTKKN